MDKTEQPVASVYQFDDYTLNTATFELRRNNRVIELEPKLFQILSALVRHHPRVITKEELLNDIWGGRVVTPNAISRAIYQLRKIIDSDHAATLIKTVRGVGYQLDCPVIPQNSAVKNPKPRHINTRYFLLGLFIVALLVTGYFIITRSSDSSSGQAAASGKPSQQSLIAILPTQSDGISKNHINLSNTLIDYLTIELQNGLGVRVIHPDRIMTLNKAQQNITDVHRTTRATHILETFISEPSPDVMRLHLTLYQKTKAVHLEPFSLGYFDFPWPDNNENLQSIYTTRKQTVNEIAKLIKPEIRFEISQNMQTADAMTYRLVIASHHAVVNDQCEGVVHAINLLQQAVQRDPGYVYAWHQLMSVYFKNIWLCGSPTEYYEKALAAADQVEQLSNGLFPSVAIARNAVLIETNRVEQAYERNIQYKPDQTNLIYLIVTNLRYAGFLKQAKQHIDKILSINPYFYSARPINAAPNTLLYLRDYDAHLSLLTVPGHIYHDFYRALNYYVQGDTNAAVDILSTHPLQKPSSTFQYYMLALSHICLQQFDQAIDAIDTVVALRRTQGHQDGEMTYKQAQLYAMAGDKDAAFEQLTQSLEQGFFPAQYWQNDPALISLKDDPRFNDLYKRAQQRHRAFAKKFQLTPEF